MSSVGVWFWIAQSAAHMLMKALLLCKGDRDSLGGSYLESIQSVLGDACIDITVKLNKRKSLLAGDQADLTCDARA